MPNADNKEVKTPVVSLKEGFAEKLDAIVKYKYKDRIALHGVLSIEKAIDHFRAELVCDLVDSRFDALKKQMDNRVSAEQSAYFRLLIAKGTNPAIATFVAYDGLSIEAATKKAEALAIAVVKEIEDAKKPPVSATK